MLQQSINARCRKILELLLAGNEYTTLESLEKELEISRRSIYYDICKINEWLDCYDLPELLVERKKGVGIAPEIRFDVEKLLLEEHQEEEYVYLPTERVKIIVCYMIQSREPVYIEQLMEFLNVSRNTIFNDLRVVVNQLHEYDLSLDYQSKKGYTIGGDTIRIRALFLLYFGNLRPLFEAGILQFFDRQEMNGHLERLTEIEQKLGLEYVDGILLSLAALMPVLYRSESELYFPGMKKNEIMNTKEYELTVQYFPDLPMKEQLYLCLHLLGSRSSIQPEDFFDLRSNQSVYGITKALVTEFEKVACVSFQNRDELERALFLHISTSLYRYQYGIQLGEALIGDVIREYPHLFEITKVVSKYMEQMLGMPIPDVEVAYLALHFGSYLQTSDNTLDQLRILIVCVNGISTGNMLKKEVQRLLPDARIVGCVPAVNVVNVQEICDLVISTIRIQSQVPLIVVHPILTDNDRSKIRNHRLVAGRQRVKIQESLFEAVKKYVNKKDYDNLKKDILRCFQGQAELVVPILEKENGLLEYLNEERIQIVNDSMFWQDSVRRASQILVEKESITENYVETMISQTLSYGGYMFLNNEVMLAHAKPEDGVNRIDISLSIFREPAVFPGGRRENSCLCWRQRIRKNI